MYIHIVTKDGMPIHVLWVYKFENCFVGSQYHPSSAQEGLKFKSNFGEKRYVQCTVYIVHSALSEVGWGWVYTVLRPASEYNDNTMIMC